LSYFDRVEAVDAILSLKSSNPVYWIFFVFSRGIYHLSRIHDIFWKKDIFCFSYGEIPSTV
jgi:hypothetical protein